MYDLVRQVAVLRASVPDATEFSGCVSRTTRGLHEKEVKQILRGG